MQETSSGERVYLGTKGDILTCEMCGGQSLCEAEVAGQLGVSRTPVHEAALRLAADDLLDLLPRRGAVVVPVALSVPDLAACLNLTPGAR